MSDRRRAWAAVGVTPLLTGLAAYRLLFSEGSQVLGAFPDHAARTDRTIALTFDDGPNEPHTSAIADVLAARGVPATFFCVGSSARRHPAVVRRLLADGHAVGNHSEHHQMRDYLRSRSYEREIASAQETLEQLTGVRPVLFRPPWLFRQPWLLASARRHDLHTVSGRFAHPGEVFQPPGPRLVAAAMRRVAPGAVLILHDGVEGRGGFRGNTAAAVAPLVDRMIEQGYGFARVDDLFGIPRPPLC